MRRADYLTLAAIIGGHVEQGNADTIVTSRTGGVDYMLIRAQGDAKARTARLIADEFAQREHLGVAAEGLSRRYSAISLIGLAGEGESAAAASSASAIPMAARSRYCAAPACWRPAASRASRTPRCAAAADAAQPAASRSRVRRRRFRRRRPRR